ncbi:hypothetical protein J6590_012241 [Homalodisca vitripennis]|nr:hypothetical protein J6590_012241 [Homalodisca vitripennis]
MRIIPKWNVVDTLRSTAQLSEHSLKGQAPDTAGRVWRVLIGRPSANGEPPCTSADRGVIAPSTGPLMSLIAHVLPPKAASMSNCIEPQAECTPPRLELQSPTPPFREKAPVRARSRVYRAMIATIIRPGLGESVVYWPQCSIYCLTMANKVGFVAARICRIGLARSLQRSEFGAPVYCF